MMRRMFWPKRGRREGRRLILPVRDNAFSPIALEPARRSALARHFKAVHYAVIESNWPRLIKFLLSQLTFNFNASVIKTR